MSRLEIKAEAARKHLREQCPLEFRDGARCGFLRQQESARSPGGYPSGFVHWPAARRNAWFAGFNLGFHDRLRLSKAVGA